MSTTRTIDESRGHIRCGICKQKGIFLCEHDTPYRDLYLGVFNPNLPRDIVINTEKPTSHNGTQDHTTNNNGLNKTTNGQSDKSKRTKESNKNAKTAKQASENETEKKKKGCTIL